MYNKAIKQYTARWSPQPITATICATVAAIGRSEDRTVYAVLYTTAAAASAQIWANHSGIYLRLYVIDDVNDDNKCGTFMDAASKPQGWRFSLVVTRWSRST